VTPVRRVALNLQRLRKARRWSQSQLAEKAGLSREYVTRIERGRQDPTLGTLERLAKALKVKLVDVVK
jgi:transcriptional regulator with XRE-family HTH domain